MNPPELAGGLHLLPAVEPEKRIMAKSGLVGACGEFYVAAFLSKAGLIVALPRAGVPGTDMFVSAVSHGPPLRVQVKTATLAKKRDRQVGEIYLWSTSLSVIDAPLDNSLWYAYVWLNGWPEDPLKPPETFFVRSSYVVEKMKLVRAEIATSPKTWPYFWMTVAEADKYKDCEGAKLLRAATTG